MVLKCLQKTKVEAQEATVKPDKAIIAKKSKPSSKGTAMRTPPKDSLGPQSDQAAISECLPKILQEMEELTKQNQKLVLNVAEMLREIKSNHATKQNQPSNQSNQPAPSLKKRKAGTSSNDLAVAEAVVYKKRKTAFNMLQKELGKVQVLLKYTPLCFTPCL